MYKMNGSYPFGYYDLEDLEAIDFLLNNLKSIKYPILEIGCAYGRSTSVLAKFAKQMEQNIFIIDPFYGGEERKSGNKLAFLFISNMLKLNLYDVIRILPMRSKLAAKLPLLEQISILHLDGSHLATNINADVVNFAHRTQNLIIFHDNDKLSVQKAEKLLSSCFKLMFQGKNIDVFEKKEKI